MPPPAVDAVHSAICPREDAKRGPGDPTTPRPAPDKARWVPDVASPSRIAHLCLDITVEPDGTVSEVKTLATDNPDYAALYANALKANQRYQPSQLPDGSAVRGNFVAAITVTSHPPVSQEDKDRFMEHVAMLKLPPVRSTPRVPTPAEIEAALANDRRIEAEKLAWAAARMFEPPPEPEPPPPPDKPRTLADCEGDGYFARAIASCPDSTTASRTSWFFVRRLCAKLGARPEPDCSTADPKLLDMAAQSLDLESVEWLTARGMRRRAGEPQEWQSIRRCGDHGAKFDVDYCDALLKAVLHAGWNLNEPRAKSQPLVGANETMTWLMLKQGADPDLSGEDCRSVLDIARETNAKTVSLLEQHGARPRNPIVKADCAISAKLNNVVRGVGFILFFPGAH